MNEKQIPFKNYIQLLKKIAKKFSGSETGSWNNHLFTMCDGSAGDFKTEPSTLKLNSFPIFVAWYGFFGIF